jgi:hypothetical protein
MIIAILKNAVVTIVNIGDSKAFGVDAKDKLV